MKVKSVFNIPKFLLFKKQTRYFTTYNNLNIFDTKKALTLSKPIQETPFSEEEAQEIFKNYSVVIHEELMKELDEIPHNVKVGNIEYKYGIPAKNLPFTEIIPKMEEPAIPNTITENVFELLGLDKNSSYESMLLKSQEEFNSELDMYGNIVKAGETKHEVFSEGIPIPLKTLKNDMIMEELRRNCLYNPDIPGNIEDVHPNKFIANLRPIEEFRHTPIVPISEKEIRDYQKKIEDKRRAGVYFEIKKQTVYYYVVATVFAIFLYRVFKYFYAEGEKMTYEVERLRLKRYRNRSEDEDLF